MSGFKHKVGQGSAFRNDRKETEHGVQLRRLIPGHFSNRLSTFLKAFWKVAVINPPLVNFLLAYGEVL